MLSLTQAADIEIISLVGALGPAPCAKVCAGTTGTATIWQQFEENGSQAIATEVDISACGFASTPIITTSLEGISNWHSVTTGGSSVSRATKDSFNIYIYGLMKPYETGPALSAMLATNLKWKVNWSTIGFTCSI